MCFEPGKLHYACVSKAAVKTFRGDGGVPG